MIESARIVVGCQAHFARRRLMPSQSYIFSCPKPGAKIMTRVALPTTILGGVLFALLQAAPAQAQATRTWVSGVGDDVNPCSRTAPCKTFAGAISKTAAGGEIDCLDPGGFGTVTITKSITIDCHEIYGSVLVSGTN